MPKPVTEQRIVRFDKYEVDLQTGNLRKRGMKVMLREQSFTVLALLLEHPGELVTRDELRRRLWSEDVFVDFDNLLNTAVARLRSALGDSAKHPRFIETLAKRGYRFVGCISETVRAPVQTPAWRVRLVVLPFANLSGDPGQEYFSDAVTDEIITALAALAPGHLAVIARTTTMHYKGSDKNVSRISRELGVDHVVEGGVHRSQDRLSINVQLIQVKDQMHLFARKYDAELRDIFKTVNRAASDIADSIGITPIPDDKREDLAAGGQVRKKPTEDLAAYNEYIQARYHMGTTIEGFARAKQHLNRAIVRDPEFALAYDALAELQWYLGYMGFVSPREAFSAGIVHALRALEIDGTRAETHALLGQFHKTVEYNWPEVQREMALALRLDPTSPLVRLRYAISGLMPHGRVEEAIAELEQALESDPMSLLTQGWLGIMLMLARRYDAAIDQARRLLQLDPAAFWGHFVMGTACREKHMFEQAITAHRMAIEVIGGQPLGIGWLGLTLGLSGNAAEARSLLTHLHTKAAQGYVAPTSIAWIYLGLAEIDAAFEWLNRAVDECDQIMMPIKSYSFFDPIRADPRFQALLRKMNLEP
jgi:TolB-like protein/Tfp pilus assembly protein PilF